MKKEQYDYIENTLRELSLFVRNTRIEEEKEEFRKQFFIVRDNTGAPLRNDTEDLKQNNEESGITEIFTKQELENMPKKIQQLLLIEKKRCYVRQHPKTNGYEIRLRNKGYNISASGMTIKIAKAKFLIKLKNAKPKQNSNEFIIPETFNSFATYFFDNFRKERLADKTFRADQNRYNNYLKPFFREKPLKQITPLECQQLLKKIKASGKGKTADEIFSLLSIIFKGAIKHGILERNPLDVVYFVKHETKHGSAFTLIEEKELRTKIKAIEHEKIKLGLALMLFTGLRPNELKSAQINGTFIVAINSKRKHKRIEYKKIPIIKALKPFLNDGINVSFSDRTLDKMRSTIKILFPNHILYDLRTTFYTRCKEYGVSESAICAFVGHSLGELGNAYTDLSNEYLIKEAKKLDLWD